MTNNSLDEERHLHPNPSSGGSIIFPQRQNIPSLLNKGRPPPCILTYLINLDYIANSAYPVSSTTESSLFIGIHINRRTPGVACQQNLHWRCSCYGKWIKHEGEGFRCKTKRCGWAEKCGGWMEGVGALWDGGRCGGHQVCRPGLLRKTEFVFSMQGRCQNPTNPLNIKRQPPAVFSRSPSFCLIIENSDISRCRTVMIALKKGI